MVEGVKLNEAKILFSMADTDDDGFMTHEEVMHFLYTCRETREGRTRAANAPPQKKTAEALR